MLTLERRSPQAGLPLVERIRSAIELLELIAADWRLLDDLPVADRRRLHRAIAGLVVADPRAQRKRTKAAKAERIEREEQRLNATGIRTLRRRIVTTPNVFPPPAVNDELGTPMDERRSRPCYICKCTRSTISCVRPART